MPAKLTHSDIIPRLQKGVILLKLDKVCDFRCADCGHVWSRTTNAQFRSSGCPACSERNRGQRFVKPAPEMPAGITLVTYGGSRGARSTFRCNEGHEWETTCKDMLTKGSGCKVCINQRNALAESEVIARLPEGVKLIKYCGTAEGKSVFTCADCGCEREASAHNVMTGQRYCKDCGQRQNAKSRVVPREEIERRLPDNITLLTYAASKGDSEFKCGDCGKSWVARVNNVIVNNSGCPHCAQSTQVSRGEIEVREHVKSLGVDVEHNVKSLIAPYELDIVVESSKVAIEFNGEYWHKDRKGYHMMKRELCESQGYRLISVSATDWSERRHQIERIIAHALGKSSEPKVGARKCQVVELTSSDYMSFMERNHVQRGRVAAIRKGLVHPEMGLVAAIGVANDGELVRYATSCTVQGGLSRLLKGTNCTYTFTDYDYFTGSAYEAIGFKVVSVVESFRIWSDRGYFMSRQKWQHANIASTLKEMGKEIGDYTSQRDAWEKAGCGRLFNSGTARMER